MGSPLVHTTMAVALGSLCFVAIELERSYDQDREGEEGQTAIHIWWLLFCCIALVFLSSTMRYPQISTGG